MTAHKVTQADREAAAKHYHAHVATKILAGKLDDNPLVQSFAAHRIAAEQSRDDVIEECAKVAEGHRYDDPLLDVCGMRRQHRHDLSQAIRAMKGSKT